MTYLIQYFDLSYQHKIKVLKTQEELLFLLATGKTLKQIAIETNKTYNNIKKRTQALYKKFEVTNRSDLIAKAIACRILINEDVQRRFKKRFIKPEKLKKSGSCSELTEREMQYLKLAAAGKTQKEIIQIMDLCSTFTAQYIRGCICAKLNGKNLAQAACQMHELENASKLEV